MEGRIGFDDPKARCPVKWQGRWHALRDSASAEAAHERARTFIIENIVAQAKDDLRRHFHHAPDLIAQGRAAWAWLHREAEKGALTEDRITKEFEPMIPNYGCSCRAKWKEIRKPLTADQKQWAIDRHNDVNLSLAKPVWDPEGQ